MASYAVSDALGFFGIALLLFIIVYFLLRLITHRH